jgi:type IV pilus assembly protein PilB
MRRSRVRAEPREQQPPRARDDELRDIDNALGRAAGADDAADDEPADGPEAPPRQHLPLGEVLVGKGVLSEEDLRDALAAQTASGQRLGEVLVELGLLPQRSLVEALAEQLGLPVVDLAKVELEAETVALLPEVAARRLCAIPVRRNGRRIEVAVGDPLAEFLQPQLIDALGAPVQLLIASRADVIRAIEYSYRSSHEIDDALTAFLERAQARQLEMAEPMETLVVDENAPVVKVVNLILAQAVRDRASDVHIEPQEERVRVRVRTDGVLHELISLPASMGVALVSRIKVLAGMNIVERRRPQDGQMEVTVGEHELDVRVATSSTVFGEMCVLRLLDRRRAFFKLSELGMPDDIHERYRDLIRSPYGMVICAGPTGSGKTTTLYATLAEVNSEEVKITTIEDPVEYVIPSINQIQINTQAGVTFENGLRAILRQDPDSILVGEIRNVETARIAIQAALTGHFVMSSLHATDASSAMHRFIDMGIEPYLLASSLLGVVGQRLIRRICPHCAEPYEPSSDELAFYLRSGGGTEPAKGFMHGAGCNFCGRTGYFDRVGIYEVLRVSEEIRTMTIENAPHEEIRRLAVEQGMKPLRSQALQLVGEGVTTISEVLRTVYVL